MSFKKECSVIALPTNEADENCLLISYSNGLMSKNTNKQYFTQSYLANELKMTSHHLYVLLHDESKIGHFWKKGTWFLDLFKCVRQAGDKTMIYPNDRLIIATTDTLGVMDEELSKTMGGDLERRLPQLSDVFIDDFINSFNSAELITKISVDFIKFKRCVKCKAPYLIYVCTCGEQDNFEYYEQLKISKDNKITITKAKNSWTKEELPLDILQRIISFGDASPELMETSFIEIYDKSKRWIEENI